MSDRRVEGRTGGRCTSNLSKERQLRNFESMLSWKGSSCSCCNYSNTFEVELLCSFELTTQRGLRILWRRLKFFEEVPNSIALEQSCKAIMSPSLAVTAGRICLIACRWWKQARLTSFMCLSIKRWLSSMTLSSFTWSVRFICTPFQISWGWFLNLLDI